MQGIKIYKLVKGQLMHLGNSALPQHLASAWQDNRNILKGDPNTIQKARIGAFTVHFCPWRASRPQPAPNLNANFNEPHTPCVFDKPEIIRNEGIAAFDVNGRLYYLLININPVSDPTFVLTKAPDTDPEQLNQIIHSPDDIIDSIIMHRVFPPELSFLFNSNPAKATDAGATKNHFHLQSFPFGDPIRSLNVVDGTLQGWPAKMRVFESAEETALAKDAYTYLSVLENNDHAYNLIFIKSSAGLIRIGIIPRTLGIPSTPFHEVAPTETVGGPFYTGFLSMSNQLLFETLKKHPAEAELMLTQWQQETSVDSDMLANFDREYLVSKK